MLQWRSIKLTYSFLADLINQPFKVGLLVVDIFTKFTTIAPIKTRDSIDVMSGMLKCFSQMGGPPTTMYTDSESSFIGKDMEQLFTKHKIRHITTLSHAPVAERQIRTIKGMLYPRIEHTGETWDKLIRQVLTTFNYKQIHSITGMTPDEARDPKNGMTVKFKLEIHAKHKRKYPTISIGDEVKIYKKKTILDKERKPIWTKENYTVKEIETEMNQKFYKLSNGNSYLRHALLKV